MLLPRVDGRKEKGSSKKQCAREECDGSRCGISKEKAQEESEMWCEICHRFTHNTDDCLKNTKGQGGNNDNDDWFDGLEEEKPNVGGEEGIV